MPRSLGCVQRCSRPTTPPPPLPTPAPLVILPRLSYDNHLLTLPNDLYREILQYLFFDEIGILDRALVKRQLRDCYLSAISGTILPEQNALSVFLCCNWILQRNILLKKIKFYRSGDYLRKLCIVSKPCLETLEFIDCHLKDDDIREIGSFPRLKSLTLCDEQLSSSLLQDFVWICPQLNKLKIMECSFLSNDLLANIFHSCPLITHLTLQNCSWATDSSLDLISNWPLNLKFLNFSSTFISPKNIKGFLLNLPPSLRIFQSTISDLQINELILNKLTLPSLQDSDKEVQLLNLQSLSKILSSINRDQIINRLRPGGDLIRHLVGLLSPASDLVSSFPSSLLFSSSPPLSPSLIIF
jgi:hypothetical protein